MEKWLVLDTEHMRVKAVLCSQQDAITWQELCCSGVASTAQRRMVIHLHTLRALRCM